MRQTRPLEEIIVVDNASTDGTHALIAERYPQVTLLRMSENLGVGAGLAAGLAYGALEKRHDWVWTFDQDSVPNYDALEILLDGVASLRNLGGELGMVAPLLVHRETGTYYPPLLWRDGFVKPTAQLLNQPIWFADLVISSGCMMRRDVVERIGLPRADFFLDFIDFEYCLRVNHVHRRQVAGFERRQIKVHGNDARFASIGPGHGRPAHRGQAHPDLVGAQIENLLLGHLGAANAVLEDGHGGRAITNNKRGRRAGWQRSDNSL